MNREQVWTQIYCQVFDLVRDQLYKSAIIGAGESVVVRASNQFFGEVSLHIRTRIKTPVADQVREALA